MYERIHHRLATPRVFLRRMLRHGAAASGLVGGSLALGVVGYHAFEGLPWIDALLNAAMLMGGMGPVDALRTTAGKLFASLYALYSGLVLIAVMGILLTPIAHRVLHRFHLDSDPDAPRPSQSRPGRK